MCGAARACAAEEVGGAPSAARFYDELNPRVAVLKLTPGMDALVVDALRPACDALVVEAFGLGGIPEYDGITETLLAWVDAGKTLVMTTQCPYEGADLSVYEVGRAFCDAPGRAHGRQRYHRGAVGEDHVGACASGRPRRRRRSRETGGTVRQLLRARG